MNKLFRIAAPLSLAAAAVVLVGVSLGQAQDTPGSQGSDIPTLAPAQAAEAPPAPDTEAFRIFQGYRIAPVPLRLRGLDRDLVGLGSYIVNAQAACNDCHTNPSYAAGGDPYKGQPKKVNAAHFLAGGQAFGPFISRNITPEGSKILPAGLTFPQ